MRRVTAAVNAARLFLLEEFPTIEHHVMVRAHLVFVQPVTPPTHSTDRRSANRRFPVRKLQSPKLSPYQFEPELVWTMRSVLDSAVDQIDAANRTPATKAKMADCGPHQMESLTR